MERRADHSLDRDDVRARTGHPPTCIFFPAALSRTTRRWPTSTDQTRNTLAPDQPQHLLNGDADAAGIADC
jgi:hypothetical protein